MIIDPYAPDPGLALDLANTLTLRRARRVDRLSTVAELRSWLRERRIAPPDAGNPALDRLFLEETHRLRGALRGLLDAVSRGDGLDATSAFVMNRAAERSTSQLRFTSMDAEVRVGRIHADADPLWAALAPFVHAAGALVATVDRGRIRACANPKCPTFFIDTSRGGQRRWCSMRTCGTRDKVARHRGRAAD